MCLCVFYFIILLFLRIHDHKFDEMLIIVIFFYFYYILFNLLVKLPLVWYWHEYFCEPSLLCLHKQIFMVQSLVALLYQIWGKFFLVVHHLGFCKKKKKITFQQ